MNQLAAAHSREGSMVSDVVELSRRRPVPQLLLPIVGPPPVVRQAPESALPIPNDAALARGLVAGLPPSVPTPPAAFERSVASTVVRESLTMDVLGFALAWVMTTAAGSLVIGHVMARSQPPVVVHLPDRAQAQAIEASGAAPSCPRSSWEPPVVAAADLPAAPQSRSWPQRTVPSNEPAPAPQPARLAQDTVRHAAPPPKAWSAARARFVGAPGPSAAKAKSVPKTLVDWMRASVDPG